MPLQEKQLKLNGSRTLNLIDSEITESASKNQSDLDRLLEPNPTDSVEIENYKTLLAELVGIDPTNTSSRVLSLLRQFPPAEETTETLSATGFPTHISRISAMGEVMFDRLSELMLARMTRMTRV